MARRRRLKRGVSPAFYARRQSLGRGLFGEERYWRLAYSLARSRRTAGRLMGRRRSWRRVYSTVYTLRSLRKLLGFGPEIITIERLDPGQAMSVEAIDPRTLPQPERKRSGR